MLKATGNIVWLASYPKSGNTWFRAFLHNLFSDSDEPFDINELDKTPIASSRLLFDESAGTSASDLTETEIANLRPEVYRRISREAPELLFIKVHDAWTLNENKEPLFPADATRAVIYMIRNPLDVAVSFAHHNSIEVKQSATNLNDPRYSFCFKPDKLYNQLRQDLSDWSGHVRSWTEQSGLPVHVIRYEDLLRDSFKTFSEALDFLELNYHRDQFEKAIRNSDFRILQAQEQKKGFKEKAPKSESFFRSGRAGTWKTLLDQETIRFIIDKHGPLMKHYGYFPEINSY
ncbi:MAG: sulfotransferase domain-containing protein [Bacteroidales bacterium]|nr:sulfotransferase domain-containing protein [Bacteroidales bacterium]MBN2698691.1 sulfotransferase domain-containing protein [Bacteroidales bacterium]